jgi:TolB-like protein
MSESVSRFALFLAELRRRHVGRVAIAYGAVAFVLLQAGEIVLPAFAAPDWVLRLLVLATFLGFPVALALAWIYEITPQGIRRTADIEPYQGRASRPGRVLPRLGLLAVILVTAVGAGWWLVLRTVPEEMLGAPETAAPSAAGLVGRPTIRSLAVLPFESYAADGEQDYFTAGMHEAVIAQLSQITSLRVISRTTMMQYAGRITTVPEISTRLGVDAVIEGSVLRAEDRVRITVQLIDGATDLHLWSNSYEREVTDVIALQSEVAQAIAREIQAELTPEEETRLAQVTPVDPGAHEAYLRGRFEQSKGTPEAIRQAIGYYEQAVELDSSYVPALEALAASQLLVETTEPAESSERLIGAYEVAERAADLDPNSPEAQAIMAEVQKRVAVLTDSLGEKLGVIKIQIDSANLPNEEWITVFTEFGREMEKLALTQESNKIKTAAPSERVALARKMAALGQSDEAIRALEQAVQADPTLTPGWEALERLHVARGEYEAAAAVHRQRMVNAGAGAEALASVAELEQAVREKGAVGYWQWRREDLEVREARGESISQVDLAAAAVGVGDFDEAFTRLQRGVKAGDRKLFSLATDPIWDPIRGDARFRKILSSLRRHPRPPEPPRRP